MKTGSESVDTMMRGRRMLFAGFVARMDDTRLPNCELFGKVMGGAGCVGGQENEECILDDLRAFSIKANQWTTVAQGEGECRKTRNKGRNVSWLTGSLQRKSGMDYGLRLYMSERGGKDETEDSPKKACSFVLVRSRKLISHKRRQLVYFCCLLFCFVFVCFCFPWPFVQSFFGMHAAPTATRS